MAQIEDSTAKVTTTTTTRVGYGQTQPDLVQMERTNSSPTFSAEENNTTGTTTTTAETTATNNANPNRPNPDLFVDHVKLGLNTIGLCVFIGLTIWGASYNEQYFAVLALLPPCFFLWRVASEKGGLGKIPFVKMLTRFTTGFVLLFPIMVILCALWTAIVNIVFHFALQKLGSEQARWDISVIVFFLSLVLAEESSKLALYFVLDKRDEVARPEYYIYYSSSTALGLVTAEVYFATYFLAPLLSEGDGSKRLDIATVVTLLFIFTGFLVPMQLMGSYYIGLAAARVQVLQKNSREVLPVPVLLCVLWRTIFLYSIFLILPNYFFPGLGLAIATMVMFMWIILRYQDNMPVDYLRSTGALHIFGYGVLPADDSGADASNNDNNGNNQNDMNNNNNGNSAAAAYDDDEDEDGVVYGDMEERARRKRLREQEARMKRLQHENEQNRIEVVIPTIVAPGGGGATSAQSSNSTRIRTMFDSNPHSAAVVVDTNNLEYHNDEDGEELQVVK